MASDVDGGVWIEQYPDLPSDKQEYVVLNQAGKVRARVSLPAGSRIAHITNCCVTLVRRDADDVELVYPLTRRP